MCVQPSCVHKLGRSPGNTWARQSGCLTVWGYRSTSGSVLASVRSVQGGGTVPKVANPNPSTRDAPAVALVIVCLCFLGREHTSPHGHHGRRGCWVLGPFPRGRPLGEHRGCDWSTRPGQHLRALRKKRASLMKEDPEVHSPY